MATRILLLASLLMFPLSAMETQAAVRYTVTNKAPNTPGGKRFNWDLGGPYTKRIMATSTSFIWRIFSQTSRSADRKNVQLVSLFVDNMTGIAYTINNQIHVGASFIAGSSSNIKPEFAGVVYHEMAHIWQWNGAGKAPGGLIEGIADFVRLKAGYIPSHWVKPGQGNRWDQGYDVTARFLDYCNRLKPGFVANLNKKMRYGYSDRFFVDLLGKSVDQLWREYKAKYGQH